MAKGKKTNTSPTPKYVALEQIPTPPQGYSYVHIYVNHSKAVLSWRKLGGQAIEGRLEYPNDASGKSADVLREWAAKHLGIETEPHAINVVNP